MSVASVEKQILKLTAAERARLIDVLWDSLSPTELKSRETAWANESERRIEAFEAGKLNARGAAKVLAKIRKDLRQ